MLTISKEFFRKSKYGEPKECELELITLVPNSSETKVDSIRLNDYRISVATRHMNTAGGVYYIDIIHGYTTYVVKVKYGRNRVYGSHEIHTNILKEIENFMIKRDILL